MRNSLIEKALAGARAKIDAGIQNEKVASREDGLLKEAEEVANALEYVALSVADDGSAVGSARAEMIRDFFKKSAEAGEPVKSKTPGISANFGGDGSTQARGEQGEASSSSKKKILPIGLKGGNKPEASESRDGKMNRSVMEQAPSEKKAGTLSLYDMIQNSKIAGDGPQAMDAQVKAPGIPSKNENSNRESILSSSEGIVRATKRQAKQPGRARIAEIFAHANDTSGDRDAAAIWPQANAKGDIKVASALRWMQKEAKGGNRAYEGESEEETHDRSRRRAAIGGLIGGAIDRGPLGGGIGAAIGAHGKKAGPGHKGKAFAGGLLGGLAGMGVGTLVHAATGSIGAGVLAQHAASGIGAGGLAYAMHGKYKKGEKRSSLDDLLELQKSAFVGAYSKGEDENEEVYGRTGKRMGRGALIGGGIGAGLGGLAGGALGGARGAALGAGVYGALGAAGGAGIGAGVDKGIRQGYEEEKTRPGKGRAVTGTNLLGLNWVDMIARNKGVEAAKGEKGHRKKSSVSVADLAEVWDLAITGELGEDAQTYAEDLVESLGG